MFCQKVAKCFRSFTEYVQQCDLFAPNILLRYKNQNEFKTLTSAIISISLVVFFVIVFSNRFVSTINKQSVSLETAFVEQMDPKLYRLNTSQFMFVIGLQNLNLNPNNLTNQTRYFDIGASKISINNGTKTQQSLTLQACTPDQWSAFGEDFTERFGQLKLNQWLCPVGNQTIDLEGKFSSKSFQLMKIYARKCTGSDCATDADVQTILNQFKTFKLIFYYAKTVLNPQDHNPIVTTLDDSVYTQFSLTLGSTCNLFMESYQIDTDQSLWPSQQIQTITGITTSNTPEMRSYSITDPLMEYSSIYIRKSPKSRIIDRAYVKYDDFLSYIGGLFGIIAFLIGLPLYYYNLCCYQLSLATNMFTYKKMDDTQEQECSSADDHPPDNRIQNQGGNKIQRKDTKARKIQREQELKHSVQRFNFIVYLGFLPYFILKILGAEKMNCNAFQPYYEAIKQIRKQIDIGKILQKFTYFDRMAKCLLDQDQRNLLHVYSKQNICQVFKERIKYKYQTNALEAKKMQQNPDEKTKNILHSILKAHLTSNNKSKSDMRKLASSYNRLKDRTDQISKRILNNIDPQIIQVLRKQRMKSSRQSELILPQQKAYDLVDINIQILSQMNEDRIRRVNSLQDVHNHQQMEISDHFLVEKLDQNVSDPNSLKIRKTQSHNIP